MGNSNKKIPTTNIPISQISGCSQQSLSKHTPPFRKFNNIYNKQISYNEVQYLLPIVQPYQESFKQNVKIYKDLFQAYNQKTQNLVIKNVVFDGEFVDRYLVHVDDDGNNKTLLIRPFDSDESHNYCNILCEIHNSTIISQIDCPNLHKILESYVIQTKIDDLEEPNSHIIVMEPVDLTLSQIIKYRRQKKWDWTEEEFNSIAKDLATGLQALHSNNISHNDIRPSTVYYSVSKKCYMLGSFANCLKNEGNRTSNKIKPESHFNAPQQSHQQEFDLQKVDVYSLGMTLLCAFYMYEPIERKQYLQLNKQYSGDYSVLKLIEAMLAPVEQRKSISQLSTNIPPSSYSDNNMSYFSQALHYNLQPQKTEDMSKLKFTKGWAYQRLGLWNQWMKEYSEGYELVESGWDEVSKAKGLEELAMVEYCRGEYDSANQYAKKSSSIYRKLGHKNLEDGNLGLSELYYKKSLDTSKYFEFEHDIELARSLEGMSELHLQKGEYLQSKTLISEAATVAKKCEGKDSLEYCKLKIKEASIQAEFGGYKLAEQGLEQCRQIAARKESINPRQSHKLKANILVQNAKINLQKIGLQPQNKESYLVKAQNQLTESLGIYQSIDEDHHVEVSNIIKYMGMCQYKRENYDQAKSDFNKAYEMIKHYETESKEATEYHEKGDLLCLSATCDSALGDQQNAIETYNNALNIYRRIYGSNHNRYSAMAIGNLAKVYLKLHEKVKARECLKCSLDILADIMGKEDPDYLRFKEMEDNIDEMV